MHVLGWRAARLLRAGLADTRVRLAAGGLTSRDEENDGMRVEFRVEDEAWLFGSGTRIDCGRGSATVSLGITRLGLATLLGCTTEAAATDEASRWAALAVRRRAWATRLRRLRFTRNGWCGDGNTRADDGSTGLHVNDLEMRLGSTRDSWSSAVRWAAVDGGGDD